MKEKEQNDKVLQILEQQYQSFINLEDRWDFFRGLAEYTKTLQEMTQTKPFIEVLEAQRKATVMVYEQMNTEAMKEFVKSAQKIIPIAQNILKSQEPLIKQNKELSEKFKPIVEAIQEVHNRLSGNISSSDPLSAFDRDLFAMARTIKENGYEKAIKEFENNKKRHNNIYGNYTFSPSYEKIDEEEKKIQRKEQVEPWGAWHQLPIVKRLVFEPEEIKSEFRAEVDKDNSLEWTWLNFLGVASEMERIRKGEVSDNEVYYFHVKDFKNYVQRVHTYITKELLKIEIQENILDFDDKQSILFFMGESIKISSRAESDPHELLRTIFKDRSKLWSNDEILDDWEVVIEKNDNSVMKVYQAGKAVNRIIAQETKIKDFLILTTKNTRINEKYLKE